jgi:UDP-N-acetylmuramoyl-L-alanyl-D-glutamate--2,6-diaminopimelate ligase
MDTSQPRPLADLLSAAGIGGGDDTPVSGVTADSREVRPGWVFVAVPGTTDDGIDYVRDAVASGAAAVVAEESPGALTVPFVPVDDARRALARLAAAWFGEPASEVALVGITGSLGKTSVLTMLEGILQDAGVRVGAIGSEIVGIRVGDRLNMETAHTTPDPVTLHRGLRKVVSEGASIAAMEVSSHAIDQGRVHGMRFAAGVFTNLVPLEHQDYHGSFEEYSRIKLGFCDLIPAGAPLFYGSDSPLLVEAIAGRHDNLVSCGFGSDADIGIESLHMSTNGSRYDLVVRRDIPRRGGSDLRPVIIPVELRLLGRPHVLNSAFAAALALHLGVEPGALRRAMATLEPPARRMELQHAAGLHVLDDTAGHPDSIEAVFEVVRHLALPAAVVVAAIRGNRGAEINHRLASALAYSVNAQPVRAVIVTDSAETVDELDEVARIERDAFLGALRAGGVDPRHHATLLAALHEALELARPGDLLVLVGAQGMRAGMGALRDMHPSDA